MEQTRNYRSQMADRLASGSSLHLRPERSGRLLATCVIRLDASDHRSAGSSWSTSFMAAKESAARKTNNLAARLLSANCCSCFHVHRRQWSRPSGAGVDFYLSGRL